MSVEDDLNAAASALWDGCEFESGGTVELVDEDDPDGMVVFKDKNGTPQAWMSVEAYWGLVDAANRVDGIAKPDP